MKTIRQLADELGVSKQKVYCYIKKNIINEALHQNDIMYYDEAVENLLKSEFLMVSASSNTNQSADVEMMRFLKQQLQVKDQQIEQLRANI